MKILVSILLCILTGDFSALCTRRHDDWNTLGRRANPSQLTTTHHSDSPVFNRKSITSEERREQLSVTESVEYGELTDEARILEAVSAIERDDATSLAALIRAGLDVNATHSEPEGYDYSPDEIPSLLHWALGFEAIECVKVLTSEGADVDSTTLCSFTPLHDSVLIDSKEIAQVLFMAGANMDAKDYLDRTPLHQAAHYGYSDMTEFLIERGANISAIDDRGRTPLFLAAVYGNPDVVEVLIGRGADVNVSDTQGWTPLHYTALYNDVDTVRVLLDSGADVGAKDYASEQTPLHIASAGGCLEVAQILVEAGASKTITDRFANTPGYYVCSSAFFLKCSAATRAALVELLTP